MNVEWQYGEDMPCSMNYYPEAIMLDEKVYVGAGSTSSGLNNTVMVYSIPNNEWSLLPEYDYFWFGMTSANNKLVLVGGVSEDRTNKLGVWDEKWMDTLPPMPTARSGPTVVTYKNRWLVVAGGYCHALEPILSTVEILDILTGYWHRASPLPVRQYKMSSTIIGNMWYLLGGYHSGQQTLCNCVCIDDLIYQAVFQISSSSSQWQSLPDTPATKCTALSLDGALLAVGGYQCRFIHHYRPSTNNWVEIGELTSSRHECACIIVPSGKLLILGGNTSSQSTNIMVEIGTIMSNVL